MDGSSVRNYLDHIRIVHNTGEAVPETSYYGALETLLNAIGGTVKPRVRCILNPRNRGAGIADLGLFTHSQVRDASRRSRSSWDLDMPERGVVEAKPASWTLGAIAATEQVERYLQRYGQVLITNYREFQVIRLQDNGRTYSPIAQAVKDEAELWSGYIPSDNAQQQFTDYVASFLTRGAPITSPEALAATLALYARLALRQVTARRGRDLQGLKKALEQTLGLTFEGPEASHFFNSSLVQTLFYGIFSVWTLWLREDPKRTDDFQWRQAGWDLKLPMISTLFDEAAAPHTVRTLHLTTFLDEAAYALNRVNRIPFFIRFDPEHAIEYFYEPFLEAYDPVLRKELGVWYTPPEIVEYIVERVDRTLRVDFGLDAGLADDSVYILDPCTGTGSFLIRALQKIATYYKSTRTDDLIAADLKQVALHRLFGFEVLPAPFIITHLQVSLMLKELGASLDLEHDEPERLPVYLTNSLTGWLSSDDSVTIPFEAFQREHDAAAHIKHDNRILVVLGNPPYNAFAGISPPEEGGMLESYKIGITTRNSLNDLYVRFFRIAERQIAEITGQGIVSMISNRSYLASPSFRSMRLSLARSFDAIHIDDLNGDRDETGKRTPKGLPDPSVFSTKRNRAGIAEGTAIATLIRKAPTRKSPPESLAGISYRAFWGPTKREDLLRSLDGRQPRNPESDATALAFLPSVTQYYAFRPLDAARDFYRWPSLSSLCDIAPIYGLHEARGGALIDSDAQRLKARIEAYLDSGRSLGDVDPRFRRSWYGFTPDSSRNALMRRGVDIENSIERFVYRAFDNRYAFWTPDDNLWVAPQPVLVEARRHGARFLYARRTVESSNDGAPLLYSSFVGDQHALHKTAYLVPTVYFDEQPREMGLFDESRDGRIVENLSAIARQYLDRFGPSANPPGVLRSEALFAHALAITSSPDYIYENRGALRQRFPHIPLPEDEATWRASVRLGLMIAALHDLEEPGEGLRRVLSILRTNVATLRSRQNRPIDASRGDLRVTDGWGTRNQAGSIMPRRGSVVERPFTGAERDVIENAARELGTSNRAVQIVIQGGTLDIIINGAAQFSNVPHVAWGYKLGGFLVLKKWLSYRDYSVTMEDLARPEVTQFQEVACRLSCIALLSEQLNHNYATAKESARVYDELLETQAEDLDDA